MRFVPTVTGLETRSTPSALLPFPMVPVDGMIPWDIDDDLIAIDIEVEMFPPTPPIDPATDHPIDQYDGTFDSFGVFEYLISDPMGGILGDFR